MISINSCGEINVNQPKYQHLWFTTNLVKVQVWRYCDKQIHSSVCRDIESSMATMAMTRPTILFGLISSQIQANIGHGKKPLLLHPCHLNLADRYDIKLVYMVTFVLNEETVSALRFPNAIMYSYVMIYVHIQKYLDAVL